MDNRTVIFHQRPVGALRVEDFRVENRPRPVPQAGELLLQTLYLSMDPYLVLLMQGADRYGDNAPGNPMRSRAVSRVLASQDPAFAAGDVVLGFAPWAEFNAAKAADMIKLDPDLVPLPAYLGAVGHSGITAWAGIIDVAQAKAGETVVVSAASGAVGSVAGQIARILGCKVVGIAGGADKVRHVVDELKFDACIDYKQPGWVERLYAAVPQGIDVYFENVGGAMFDAVLGKLNKYSRIALCGLISGYQQKEPVTLHNFKALMEKTVTLRGFSVYDYTARRDEIIGQLAGWVNDGRLAHHETITHGIENAPTAMVAMLAGNKLGKQLIEV